MTERGAKYVSGQATNGFVVLTREDGTTTTAPFLTIAGTITDNGDGTCTLTTPGEE